MDKKEIERELLEKELVKRGDLAVETIRKVLADLGLLIAFKDMEVIFADKETYIKTGEKVSVATRIGELNRTGFSSSESIPEHLRDNIEYRN